MINRYYITPEEYAIAAANGIDANTVNMRVRSLCWPVERAISAPIHVQIRGRADVGMALRNGISYSTFYSRLRLGWTAERAATEPLVQTEERRERARQLRSKERHPLAELIRIAERHGVKRKTFFKRIERGWNPQRAATTKLIAPSENGSASVRKINERYGDINALIFRKGGSHGH